MKKARIILSCIALLTVVGGAFAFKAMTTQGRAYSYTGTTLSSTITAGKTYYTIVPVCVPVSIGPSAAYLSNIGLPATNLYATTLTNRSFSTTTAPGVWTYTTLPVTTCDFPNPKVNTFITTVQ